MSADWDGVGLPILSPARISASTWGRNRARTLSKTSAMSEFPFFIIKFTGDLDYESWVSTSTLSSRISIHSQGW
jgi:hypothetical protein